MSPPVRNHWLFKTDPESFSFADLVAEPRGTTAWDGVRNYQARNSLRDDAAAGARVLIYHSSSTSPAVVGLAEIVRAAYPDATAFDPGHEHFDPKSKPAAPTWVMVDVRALEAFSTPVSLAALKANPKLASMAVVQRGQRLSIQPVRPAEWAEVLRMAGQKL